MPQGEKTKKLWEDPLFRKRMSLAQVGRKHSDSSKEKMRLAKRGYITWMVGKKHSKVSRQKISDAKLGKKLPPFTDEHKMRIGEANRGNIRLDMLGEKNYNWKGGVTPLNIAIRNCSKMDEWRLIIFKRDHFTCCGCGKKIKKIHADHIKTFAMIIKENKIKNMEEALKCDELWDINNGRTLCIPCHEEITRKQNIKL